MSVNPGGAQRLLDLLRRRADGDDLADIRVGDESTCASASNGVPFSLPPRMSTVGAAMPSTPRMVASGFVPLLSLIQRTPSSSRVNSIRCSTPANVRSVWRMTGQRHARFRRQRRGGQRVFKVVRAGNADFFRGAQAPVLRR